MGYFDKKQAASRRNTVRNGLKSERTKAYEMQRKGAIDILNRVNRPVDRNVKRQTGLLFGTAELANKVLHAFGVTVPVKVGTLWEGSDQPLTAWTNFKEININVRPTVDLNDLESVAEFVWMIKGAVYHEGGHCLFTRPLPRLIDELQQLKAANPGGEAERLLNTMITSGYMNSAYSDAVNRREMFFKCWNILEDQRMEMAMVTTSPVLATYFSTVVLKAVVNSRDLGGSWPYISGRMYIDYDIRKGIRDEACKTPERAARVNQLDSVVARYRVAKTPVQMLRAVCDFVDIMDEWGGLTQPDDLTGKHTSYGDNTPQPTPDMDENPGDYGQGGQQEGDEQEGEQEGEQQGAGDADDEKQSDGSSAGDSGGGDEPPQAGQPDGQPERPSSPQSAASGPSNDTTAGRGKQDLIKQIQKQIESGKPQITNEVMTFVSKINEEMRHDLPRDPTVTPMKAESIVAATTVKSGIINSLEHLIDQTAPSWRFRREAGVLDPTAYVLREPGETDFWTDLDDIGGNGYDLSVSVVLDTSYSMDHHTERLSEVGLGVRLACDDLGIPCSVSTFNSYEYAVYRADEQAIPVTVRADGGTEAFGILSMLDTQRFNKKRHLVLILTDGDWADVPTLAPFSAPGRYFLLLGLDMYNPQSLLRKNADHTMCIRTLDELPTQFTRAMAGFIA